MLIIDEKSMMSKRTFEMLECVLRLKDPCRRFGGMQVILVRDFMQLPLLGINVVRTKGNSALQAHSIILEEIMRQSDDQVIKCVQFTYYGVTAVNQSEAVMSAPVTLLPGESHLEGQPPRQMI